MQFDVLGLSSSDDEEDLMDHGDDTSLERILQELKNAQSELKESRSENRSIFNKLTKKLGQFHSLALSVGVSISHLSHELMLILHFLCTSKNITTWINTVIQIMTKSSERKLYVL